jgi:hypothetical protein
MAYYEVEVPGKFLPGITLLDLETVKVPIHGGFEMANGEMLRKRWSIAMAGIARDGRVVIIDTEGDESEGLRDLGVELEGATEVVYGATREFDEMICKGQFTNARRAHATHPFFPAVPGAEDLEWRNVKDAHQYDRLPDVPSRDIAFGALTDGRWDLVMIHLLRDVAELILMAGEPDGECEAWCLRVLAEEDFASNALA